MYYVPGQGYFEGEPNTYTNAQGQTVVQSSGVVRNNDGSLHKAYQFQPQGISAGTMLEKKSSPTSGNNAATSGTMLERYNAAIAKWRRGEALTEEEIALIQQYSEATQGLPSLPKGFNGLTTTAKEGTKKMTQKTSGYTSQTGNWQLSHTKPPSF